MRNSELRNLIRVSDEFPIGFIVFREDGETDRILSMNEMLAIMCGFASGKEMYENRQGTLSEIMHPDDYSRIRNKVHVDEAPGGRNPEQWCYYFRLLKKDHEYLTVRGYLRNMSDPEWGKVYTFFIAADQDQNSENWHDASNVEREDRILNEAIDQAISASDPDTSINAFLSSVGKTLQADRAYIFEYDENQDGINTYDWCAEGVRSIREDFQHTPPELFDFLWKKLLQKHQNVVIRNVEEYRKMDPDIAKLLKKFGIRRVIVAPLFLEKHLIGFLGVDNPPAGSIGGFTRMLDFFAGFTAVLIRYRDYTKQMTILNHQEHTAHQAITRAQLKQNPDEGLQELLVTIGSQYHSDRSSIFELNPDGGISNTYEWHAGSVSPAKEHLQEIGGVLFEHAFGRELRKNHDVVVRDMNAFAKSDPEIAGLLQSVGIHLTVVAPLFLQNHLIGLIAIDNLDPEGIENTAILLHLIAGFAAGLIQSRDSYRRIHDQVDRNEIYNQLTEKALTTHDPDEALRSFLVSIAGMIPADHACICELAGEDAVEPFRFFWKKDDVEKHVLEEEAPLIHLFEKTWEDAIHEGKVIAIKDVEKDDAVPEDQKQLLLQYGVHRFIQLPMLIEEHYGVVGFLNPPVTTLQAPYTTYKMVTMFIGSLLRHRCNIYHLRSISDHDQLTGVRNRRALQSFIQNLDPEKPLGMIYSDLNRLKETNDLYGHKAGDRLIIRFSGIMETFCPEEAENGVFRIGGDEFLAVFTGRSKAEIRLIAEKMQEAFEKNEISAAIGSEWSPHCREDIFDRGLRKAEERMYIAKREWHSKN